MLLFSRNYFEWVTNCQFLDDPCRKALKKGSVDTSSVGHTSLTHLSIFSLFYLY